MVEQIKVPPQSYRTEAFAKDHCLKEARAYKLVHQFIEKARNVGTLFVGIRKAEEVNNLDQRLQHYSEIWQVSVPYRYVATGQIPDEVPQGDDGYGRYIKSLQSFVLIRRHTYGHVFIGKENVETYEAPHFHIVALQAIYEDDVHNYNANEQGNIEFKLMFNNKRIVSFKECHATTVNKWAPHYYFQKYGFGDQSQFKTLMIDANLGFQPEEFPILTGDDTLQAEIYLRRNVDLAPFVDR